MNTEDTTTDFDFQDTPTEVLDFISSDEFIKSIDQIANHFSLSPEQRTTLSGSVVGLLTQSIPLVEINSILDGLIPDPRSRNDLSNEIDKNIIEVAYKKVINELKQINDNSSIEESLNSLNNSQSEDTAAVTPAEMLARLSKDTFRPTIFGNKNDADRSNNISEMVNNKNPRNYIDPYREIPEI